MPLQAKINSIKKSVKPRNAQQLMANAGQPWEISINLTISAEDGRDIDSYGLFPIIASVDAALQEELYRSKILKSHDGELDPGLRQFAKTLGGLC